MNSISAKGLKDVQFLGLWLAATEDVFIKIKEKFKVIQTNGRCRLQNLSWYG